MTSENKKFALYVGIAIAVGSIGFLAYANMTKKPKEQKNTSSDNKATAPKKCFANMPVFSKDLGVTTPSVANDLLNSFK